MAIVDVKAGGQSWRDSVAGILERLVAVDHRRDRALTSGEAGMRTAYLTTELLGESAAPASQTVRGLLRKRWDAFKERRERARVKAILYGMQDRELNDLGFTRSEIESVMVDSSGERARAYSMPNGSRG